MPGGQPPSGAGGNAGVPVMEPLMRQMVYQPAGRKAGSRREAGRPALSLPERGEVGVAGPRPSSNKTKARALSGPAPVAPSWCRAAIPQGSMDERHVGGCVRDGLVGIHPHPGPDSRRGVRSRGEMRRARNERRNIRRRRRGGVNENESGNEEGANAECVIVTWNVRRLSVRENNRRRLRRVAERVVRENWEVVLVSELKAEESGVVWLGEEEEEVVLIHGRKAGVMLRGAALRMWVEEGQQKWLGERVVAVVLGGLRLVSVYQPSRGADEQGMERCRRDMESQVAMNGNERLVIGGDFNASVGRNAERRGVCGKYGLGIMNEAGRDLIEWCEVHGLAYVNSYMGYARRGTWRHMARGTWHELDGFLVKGSERHRMVKRMWTKDEYELSDHRPVCMRVRDKGKRWRKDVRSEKRVPKIKWEMLNEEEKKREYEEKTREKFERRNGNENERMDEREWEVVAEVMVESAEEVCGRLKKEIANPWTIGREEEIEEKVERIRERVNRRNERMDVLNARRRLRVRRGGRGVEEMEVELERVRGEVKEARKDLKRLMRRLERDWWKRVIGECEEACARGKIGEMYKCLRKLGTRNRPAARSTTVTVSEFKEHFERVSKDRYEEEPRVIEEAVRGAVDLRNDRRAREANELLNEVPEREEIMDAMKEMRESAPGKDGVRIGYIRNACEEVKGKVIEIVRKMFECRADKWEESAKVGLMVPLHKKGDRNDRNNYRGVCLLSMCSRVLGRVLAKRLGWWAEHLELLDENQAGFRKGRSTADVTQMMVRIHEDVEDGRRRENEGRMTEMNEDDWPTARLLDLRKAYPRVSKPALWMLLERYGMSGKCLETIMDLHETTEYKVRGREGTSEGWKPARGLREGCSTSPVLFNVYHQAVMRQAMAARSEDERDEREVVWKWIPGGMFAGEHAWERGCTEAKEVRVTSALFADDTTIVGTKGEIDESVRRVKGVMNKWEERNNDDKEEVLEFGTEEGEEIRVLGSWMGMKVDASNRIKRAGRLWGSVKEWLKGSLLSKRWQARVVEACVESSLLYDCQARMWYKKDVKRLQKWMDKCYRYVWSDRNGEPLRQMSERGVNMYDVRRMLGVKSVEWKIERRVLERIGHVMRMKNDRVTKAMVLGWWERLEGEGKMKGRKRKTVLYWKRMMKDAGMDCTEVERLTSDRDGWKRRVNERMEHVYKWECQKGNRYVWEANEERLERAERRRNDGLVCRYEGCGKVCRNRAGLVMHEKRMHRVNEERVRFECGKCRRVFESEGNRISHERSCTGGAYEEGRDRRQCGGCERWISKANYARHVRGCERARRVRGEEEVLEQNDGGGADRGRGGRRRVACGRCGRMMLVGNVARHQREACRVWDPGGGANP